VFEKLGFDWAERRIGIRETPGRTPLRFVGVQRGAHITKTRAQIKNVLPIEGSLLM
jgi:hypothetical protein